MRFVSAARTALFLVLTPQVLIGATANAAPAPAPAASTEFYSTEAILRWMYAYRSRTDPARAPSAYSAASQLGALKDPEAAGIYVGFLAGLIAADPAKADRLIAKMFPIAAADEWVIIRAIAYSGHTDCKGLLQRSAPRIREML